MSKNEIVVIILLYCSLLSSQTNDLCNFNVLAFYTAKNDLAHISFVEEANTWFPEMGEVYNFCYEATDDWSKLNSDNLATTDVVFFLDTRPDAPEQRLAFEQYMRNGGAWMGFHFAGFALTPSDFPDDWQWYQNEFLGCGAYHGNTWKPTSAMLKVESTHHPITQGFQKFNSAPNEWYRWEKDLRKNPHIQILLSIDPISFPLGTGPKPHEIWHSGYFPVVWTHNNYKMIYFNMGHNDMDYGNKTNKPLSATFSSPEQNKLFVNSLLWLAKVPIPK